MKRLITIICLMTVAITIIGTEECQAGRRSQKGGSQRVQRTSGSRSQPRRNVSRGQTKSRSTQSIQRNRTPQRRGSAQSVVRKPITRKPMNTRPTTQPSTGTTRPRPIKRPGQGSVRPTSPGLKPTPGMSRPRPLPKPGNGTVRPTPTGIMPRPGIGNSTIRPRPFPKPTNGGIKPTSRPISQPGLGGIKPRPGIGGIKPMPRPFPKPNGGVKPRPNAIDPVWGASHNHNNRPWFNQNRRSQFSGHWCFKRPTRCHWWFDYCTPLAQCNTVDIVTCDFVQCCIPQVILVGGEAVSETVWYIGLKGMILPDTGLGIEEVDPDSPAAQAGLEAGMVIISCNDIQITEEADMQQAIEASGGTLTMIVQLEDGSQGEAVVEMVRVPAGSN